METSSFDAGIPPRAHSFRERENACLRLFNAALRAGNTFWHICTPGNGQAIIFRCRDDYAFGMTAVATCAHDAGVTIITFELMSNHVHFIIRARSKEAALDFFRRFRKRLQRYFSDHGKIRDLTGFDCGEPVAIEDLDAVRNQIVYTNRNNYLVDPNQTPFSFPFGANACYFNPWAKNAAGKRLGELSKRAQAQILQTKKQGYPDHFQIYDGYIHPASFCDISFGEEMFRDARHYFYKLSRDIEAFKNLSEVLGDTVYYTDDELLGTVYALCHKNYSVDKPAMLPLVDKQDLARTLHFDYRADNKKIARLVNLSEAAVDALFPLSANSRRKNG